MRKMGKYIGIAVLVFVALIVIQSIRYALTPAVPEHYTETVKTGGPIESTYLKNGSHAVSYFEQKTDEDFRKYEVWYPQDLETSDRTYPLLVVLNGTGVKASKYRTQFEHFASWGFIVIGTEEKESWDAEAADASLAFMLEQNGQPDSVFCGRIDTENIGAVGHSQGGAGVFNAVTVMEHSRMYKTAVSLSPTNEERTVSLKWSYDLGKIEIPILLFGGTEGDFEMEYVLPAESMISMYKKIGAPKAMARKLDCEHGDMLYSADGYVTAWFMWQLQGDKAAAAAFTGDGPELLENELYTGSTLDLPE